MMAARIARSGAREAKADAPPGTCFAYFGITPRGGSSVRSNLKSLNRIMAHPIKRVGGPLDYGGDWHRPLKGEAMIICSEQQRARSAVFDVERALPVALMTCRER